MKSPLKSKTLWFNILAGAAFLFGPAGALGHVFATEEITAFMGVGNIVLRFMTDKGILSNGH